MKNLLSGGFGNSDDYLYSLGYELQSSDLYTVNYVNYQNKILIDAPKINENFNKTGYILYENENYYVKLTLDAIPFDHEYRYLINYQNGKSSNEVCSLSRLCSKDPEESEKALFNSSKPAPLQPKQTPSR